MLKKPASRPCLCQRVGENVGFFNIRIRRTKSLAACFLLASTFATALWIPSVPAVPEKQMAVPREFSGTLIKQVNGKKYQAQVFAKGDRLRLESNPDAHGCIGDRAV